MSCCHFESGCKFETHNCLFMTMMTMRYWIFILLLFNLTNSINPIEVSGRKFLDSVTGAEVRFLAVGFLTTSCTNLSSS